MAAKRKEAAATFDDGMRTLEGLVAELEAGELPLEKALASFETGVGLVRGLNEQLNKAEKKVELLSRSAAGDLVTETLEDEDDSE